MSADTPDLRSMPFTQRVECPYAGIGWAPVRTEIGMNHGGMWGPGLTQADRESRAMTPTEIAVFHAAQGRASDKEWSLLSMRFRCPKCGQGSGRKCVQFPERKKNRKRMEFGTHDARHALAILAYAP